MKYIKLDGLSNKVPIFDNEDLCNICAYPITTDGEYKGKCLSCRIFFKNKKITGGELYFDKIFSVGKYIDLGKSIPLDKGEEDTMTFLILNSKNEKEKIPFCAELLKIKIDEVSSELNISKDTTIICVVPDEEKKVYQKGNELAKTLSEKTGLDYLPIIKKIKETKKQKKLRGIEEKFENVKGAFGIDDKFVNDIYGKIIILVDDVINSLATVNECSKVLKESRAKNIFVFSVA
ncbi:ComF family protein, partial [Candidatus Pacearchaeota archaeon]|nr:ComF family protein [Candidatus Pacearchaeota archaeon]